MAFNLLLMGKSIFLGVFPVVEGLEWSTVSKCGLISEEKITALTSLPMGMLLLMMWFKVALACLILTSHCWFMLTSLLTQALEFLQFPLLGFGQRCP